VADYKTIHPGKIYMDFFGGDGLMKKAQNAAKKKMPDPSVLEGIPTRNPHEEFAKKDAIFKKRRGAQR
jgi:hypothetical protein